MTYKEQTASNLWLPTAKGDTIEGNVQEKKMGQYGDQWIIKQRNGEILATPSHKVLQSRMQNINKGDQIKIVFEGTELPKVKGQNPTQMYKVYKDE